MIIYHYGVNKPSITTFYPWPACSSGNDDAAIDYDHINRITSNRGKVSCLNCRTMMGDLPNEAEIVACLKAELRHNLMRELAQTVTGPALYGAGGFVVVLDVDGEWMVHPLPHHLRKDRYDPTSPRFTASP